MKKISLALSCLLLAGCANFPEEPAVVVTTPRVEWPDADYGNLQKTGKNTVTGQAFMKTRGGDVKTCAGETVYLTPDTAYAMQYYGADVAGILHVTGGVDTRLNEYIKTTTADASGHFSFYDVPAGDYIVYTRVSWEAPSEFGLETQGGWMEKMVTVADGGRNDFIVTE